MKSSPFLRLTVALLCISFALPVARAAQGAEPVPVDQWNFADFSSGSPVAGQHGLEFVPHGDVTASGAGADFLGGGYLELKEDLTKIAGDTFSVVLEVEQGGPPGATYGTILFAHPSMVIRLSGPKLEAACDGDWHAIAADATSMKGRVARVAATFDGTTYRLYLDGELLGERAATVDPKKSSTILVGGRPNDGSTSTAASIESFPGLVRWLKLYDSALTLEQLAAIK